MDALAAPEAWRSFCERVAALGAELGEHPAEGARHLARHVALALEGELEHADAVHPSFHRYEAPWSQWGGPNPDNVYLRAPIDPTATYRVWGDVTGVREALFSLIEGDMHLDEYGVFTERSLRELEVGADGSLELVISPDEHPGNWLATDPKARLLLIRQYQSDWEHDAIATFHIERIDRRGEPPPPPDAASVAAALDRAASWVERSLRYWQAYAMRGAAAPTNVFGPPTTPPGGAPHIAYAGGRWSLSPGDALVITMEVPDADYWGWTLHTDEWFDSGDFASSQTSVNHAQAHVDSDGRVRLVAAHVDPQVPNWIDTGGRPEGLLVYRSIGARTRPVPVAEVVPVVDVRDHVPADHPVVDAAARREELARRRAAVLGRYS